MFNLTGISSEEQTLPITDISDLDIIANQVGINEINNKTFFLIFKFISFRFLILQMNFLKT